MFSFGEHLPFQIQHNCPPQNLQLLPYCLLYLGDGGRSWVLLRPFSSPIPAPPCSHQANPSSFLQLVELFHPYCLPPWWTFLARGSPILHKECVSSIRVSQEQLSCGNIYRSLEYIFSEHIKLQAKLFFQMGSYPFFHVFLIILSNYRVFVNLRCTHLFGFFSTLALMFCRENSSKLPLLCMIIPVPLPLEHFPTSNIATKLSIFFQAHFSILGLAPAHNKSLDNIHNITHNT